jgi:hypothetical protein
MRILILFDAREAINIIDLQGLTASQISSETMAVIQLMSKIAEFYPETLNCMLVLNAPSFFLISWVLIKKIIDPRTANESKYLVATQRDFRP